MSECPESNLVQYMGESCIYESSNSLRLDKMFKILTSSVENFEFDFDTLSSLNGNTALYELKDRTSS